MNLRESLGNLLKGKNKDGGLRQMPDWSKKVLVPACAVALVLTAVLIIVSVIRSVSERNAAEASLQASEAESAALEASAAASVAASAAAESAAGEERRRTDAQNDYEALYAEYETAVEECNRAIKEYNTFLSEVEEFSVEGLPDVLEPVSSAWPSFDEFYRGGADGSALEKLTEGVTARREEAERVSKDASLIAYNVAVNDYNTVLDAYLELSQKVSLDFLEGVSTDQRRKRTIDTWIRDKWSRTDAVSRVRYTTKETQELAALYVMALQLENPSEKWVKERLITVDGVLQCEAVTKSNDPNGLLSLNGGYTTCVYFTTVSVPPGSAQGAGPVAKGTDGGGAIEVYASVEDAKCRCEYLGQYDGTLLYSGSYAILGTMVIRTSYLLSNQEQIDLTNKIMQAFTELN